MEEKFTPGPWQASDLGDYSDFDGWSRIIIGDEMRIAAVHCHGTKRDNANAHLIAAAPDMYAALMRLTYKVDEIGIDFAGKVLAKARGEK